MDYIALKLGGETEIKIREHLLHSPRLETDNRKLFYYILFSFNQFLTIEFYYKLNKNQFFN